MMHLAALLRKRPRGRTVRILKVTQAYYPFTARGGPAVKVRSIARGLVGLGNEVTVLTADLRRAGGRIWTELR